MEPSPKVTKCNYLSSKQPNQEGDSEGVSWLQLGDIGVGLRIFATMMSEGFPAMNLQHKHFPSGAFLGISKKACPAFLGKDERRRKANVVLVNT